MNLYKREIYKKSLQHAERRNHKYLYKIGDRYIYPEDVAGKAKSMASNIGSMATAAGTAAKTKASSLKEKASNTINEKKQLLKDKKYVRDSKQKKSDSYETLVSKHPYARQIQQLTSAHQTATKRTDNGLYDSVERKEAPNVEKQKQKTKQRKQAAIDVKTETQRKSAHAGYEADKKAFPEGGSTEELERQKAKTHARKRLKDDAYNRFRKDPAIDNDPEVRAARKKWLGKEENDWDGKNTVTTKSAAGRSINAHKMYDSVSRTPHEGAKRRAKVEKFIEGERSGNARNEYLAARQRAAEKDYLTQTRKARETKARTEDTVERMRKKKKRSAR